MFELLEQNSQILTLELQGNLFAIDAHSVREIFDPVPITLVPGADPFVKGLINIRGQVVPIADLRLRFDMPLLEDTIDSRFIMVEVVLNNEPITLTLRADKVHEVTDLAVCEREITPLIGMKWRPEFVQCIGKRGDNFIAVLDLPRLLMGTTSHPVYH
jgi:purine-binding chemotaxis protein CheW